MTQSSQKLELVRALAQDFDAFASIEHHLHRFNAFRVLGVVDHEIRHSNVLAWLLDPQESHCQGDAFLRAILHRLELPSHVRVDLESRRTPLVARTQREWKSIDLLVRIPSLGLAVVIENKIAAGEHGNQLRRYRGRASKLSEPYKAFVFLSLDGTKASDDSWQALSYAQVVEAVRETIRSHNVPGDVRSFIEQYIGVMEVRTLNDEELTRLCRDVFRKHGEAIRIVMESVGSPRRQLQNAFTDGVREQMPNAFVAQLGDREVHVCPRSWLDRLPPIRRGGEGEDAKAWLNIRLKLTEGRMLLDVRTRAVTDLEHRNNIVAHLTRDGNPWSFGINFPRTWKNQLRVQLRQAHAWRFRRGEEISVKTHLPELMDSFSRLATELRGLEVDLDQFQ